MIFLYLFKNAFNVIIGLLFSIIILYFYDLFNIMNISLYDLCFPIFNKNLVNIIFIIIIFFIIYYFFSLVNYLISSKTFTNYYSIILALVISSIYSFILNSHIGLTIETYLTIISVNIFMSIFVNYSCKYKNSDIL